VYSALCRVRLCVRSTVQSETFNVNFNVIFNNLLDYYNREFSWINKGLDDFHDI
jgi:hypothetical protein